jgi:hypothetical protein
MQAQDSIAWLEKNKVVLTAATQALGSGCGHGTFGAELLKKGCQVEFADEHNYLIVIIAVGVNGTIYCLHTYDDHYKYKGHLFNG